MTKIWCLLGVHSLGPIIEITGITRTYDNGCIIKRDQLTQICSCCGKVIITER
jgi:hypothetical protein